jgi:hypothetical protein
MATPFRTHLPDVEPPSYFSPILFPCEPLPLSPVDVQTIETQIAIEEVVCVVEVEASLCYPVKKVTKVKRVSRKMKSLFRFGHCSTVPLSS